MIEQFGTTGSSADVVAQRDKQEANDKKCLAKLHGALALVVTTMPEVAKTTNEIWITLK